MTINEIKRWAKEKGYSITKEKNEDGTHQYLWSKHSDASISGVTTSVSKVATAIFNHMTDNKWVDHQTKFKEEQADIKKFTVTDYGS
jgi:hypothetical protein